MLDNIKTLEEFIKDVEEGFVIDPARPRDKALMIGHLKKAYELGKRSDLLQRMEASGSYRVYRCFSVTLWQVDNDIYNEHSSTNPFPIVIGQGKDMYEALENYLNKKESMVK